MADLTDAQRKRAEARKRRRSKPDADESQAQQNEANGADEHQHDAVKDVAKIAAAGAAVGAAAAAAHALKSHHDDEQGAEAPESEAEEAPQPDEQRDAVSTDPERDGTQPAAEQREQQEPAPEPVEGAAPDDARAVIDRAREQLEELLDRRVETVSSLERTHNGWVASLEVVEFSRIPESTDVLASYEMELDDDLNLRRYQQVRRYHRGRTDRGDDA